MGTMSGMRRRGRARSCGRRGDRQRSQSIYVPLPAQPPFQHPALESALGPMAAPPMLLFYFVSFVCSSHTRTDSAPARLPAACPATTSTHTRRSCTYGVSTNRWLPSAAPPLARGPSRARTKFEHRTSRVPRRTRATRTAPDRHLVTNAMRPAVHSLRPRGRIRRE